jgi:hypothetical protein
MILLGRNIALNTLQHQGRSRENMSRSYYYLNHKNIKLNTIMKNFIAISSLLLLLCGCAISNSTHSFVHYGTDTLRDDSDFFYIKYGVLGSSSVLYNRQGGGNVRSGLIADAKANMLQQHALGPNQTYINMTIDIIRTENGKTSSQGIVINSVTITAVVSADIIEYGMPPENHEPIEQSAKLLPTDNSAPNEITNNKTTPTEYSIGESVIYTNSKNSYDARIIGFGEYNFSDRVKIEYINESGTTKKRWAYMEMISKK